LEDSVRDLRFVLMSMPCRQGGQMSLGKRRPKRCQTHFLSKLMGKFFRGKKKPQNFCYFCNFQKPV
jgi:hypothetical protein